MMKLSVLAVLVLFASVVALKAEEVDHEEDSLATVDDATLEDEITEVENDPGRRHSMRKGFCGKIFKACIIKNKGRCKAVKGCRHKFVKCRFITFVKRMKIRRCIRKVLGRHHCRRQDEPENDEQEDIEQAVQEVDQDEDEDAKKGKRRGLCKGLFIRCKKRGGKTGRCIRGLKRCLRILKRIRASLIRKFGKKRLLQLVACKRGYRKCASGQKYCGKCLVQAHKCVVKAMKRRKQDEPLDEDHELVAHMMEDEDENEEDIDVVDENEAEDAKKGKNRCGVVFKNCIVKNKGRCKAVKVCKMKFGKCMYGKLMAHINSGKKLGKCSRLFKRCINKTKNKRKCVKVIKVCAMKKLGRKRLRKLVACKKSFKNCAGRHKNCYNCLKKAHKCVMAVRGRKQDEPSDEDHELVAHMMEDEDENEEDIDLVDEDEAEDAKKGKNRCGVVFKNCIVKNKGRCKAVKVCKMKFGKCMYGKLMAHINSGKKLGKCSRLFKRCINKTKNKRKCVKVIKVCAMKKLGRKRLRKLVACKKSFKNCAGRHKNCYNCLKKAHKCVMAVRGRKQDESSDEDHELVAHMMEDEDENEEDIDVVDEDEAEDAKKGKE